MFRNYSNYEVYDDGRIWSYSHKKFLKPMTKKDGYQIVCLVDNEGNKKWYYVHRVVWEAVTGEPIPKWMQINHRNEIKTSNMITNLELMTQKENINYGSGIARSAKARTNDPKRSKAVCAFKDGKLFMTFPSLMEAQRNGFSQGAVSECCRNCYLREGNNVYKGYEWKYI